MRTKSFPERIEKHGVSATIYAPKDKSKGYTVDPNNVGEAAKGRI